MKKFTTIRNTLLASALLGSSLMLQAQTTTWIGPASGGEWNTASSWSLGVPPSGSGVTAFIGKGTNVNYNLPMAASFGRFTNSGALSINTNGFIIESAGSGVPVYLQTNSILTINSNGVVTVTNSGAVTILSSTATAGISAAVNVFGGTLIVTNSGNFNLGEGLNSDNNIGAAFTNINGNVTISSQFAVRSRDSRFFMTNGSFNTLGGFNLNVSANDLRQFFRFTGGAANLGNITVARATTAGGLSVEGNAVVNSSSIKIGNNIASGYSRMNGGIWTNAGAFYIGDRNNPATGTRRVFFVMNGGDLVTTGADGIVINNQGATSNSDGASNDGGELDVNGGTVTTEGIYLNGPSVTQYGYARFVLAGGTIYIGTNGLVANTTGTDMTAAFTISGGTLAAKADYSINANATVSGTPIIKTADAAGTPYNIYASGVWSGGGALSKIGDGTLTFDAANTYSGNTAINAGRLALGASGSINNTPQISVASGSTFDVSAVAGYTLPANKAIAGFGVVTGDVSFASLALLKPGSNALTGTLSFSNSVTQSGGVLNQFDLSTNPSGPNNDLVVIGGDFNVSGSGNNIDITGGGPATSIHPLFNYYGTFNGDLSAFTLSGTAGYLTNITTTTPKSIAFVVTVTIRSATNVVWQGNESNNIWDVLNTTNWLNNSALDYFVSGDNVLFDDIGVLNSNVQINVSVSPASTTVASTGDYSFSGTGAIGGLGGLTKTNSGTLTITTENTYSGVTTISGGKISVATLANGGLPSTIGAATVASGNIVFDGGALEYTGVNKTIDRGATLQAGGGTLSVTDPFATLTVSGVLTGSGALTKNGNGQLTLSTANNYSGGTVINSGTVRAGQGSSITLTALGTNTVTMNGGETNAANFLFGADAQVLFNTLSVNGTNNFVTIAGNDTLENIIGNGTLYLNANSGTTLSIEGNMSTFSGTLYAGTVPNLRMHPSTGSASAVFNLGTGSCLLNNRNGNLTVQVGALIGGPSTSIQGASSANTPTTYVIGALNQPTLFEGNITEVSVNRKVNLVKVGASSLTLSGAALSYSGNTTVSNGVLALSGSSTIPNSAIVTVGAGAFFDVSALGTPTFTVGAAQTLTGNGTVNGSVDGTGTISPGTGIGTLTVTNIATLGGTLYVELNRTNGIQTNDILAASSIVLGGTLTVTNLGSELVAGDRFVLFNGPITGAFGVVNLPGFVGGVTYTWTNKTDIDGSIEVLSVTPVNQTPTNLVTSVSGNTLTLSWPSDHIGWRLQSQTNDLSTGLGSSWTEVSGASTTNSVDITLDPANGAVFYRMVYP